MSFNTRSYNGCWTCRLRKKKCDETSPTCLVCRSLALSCYGYGSKPDWMDGGMKENEVAAEVRRAVKDETARKRRLRTQGRQPLHRSPKGSKTVVAQEGHSSNAALSTPIQLPSSSHHADKGVPENSLDESLSPSTGNAAPHILLGNASIHHASSVAGSQFHQRSHSMSLEVRTVEESLQELTHTSQEYSLSANNIEENEESLLMHYLDFVFPLQFCFYQVSPSDGGRGWLLSILLRTKPLYYAAITLSEYHRQSVTCQRDPRIKCTLDELLSRHILAIKELRLFVEGLGTDGGPKKLPELVQLLASMAFLISLELFRGGTENWQLHLHAATSLIPILRTEYMALSHTHLSPAYKSALYFFIGVLGWYDILSCATTRAAPFPARKYLDMGVGYIPLEKLMGCENWAMLIIMDIAVLQEWKARSQTGGNLSLPELVSRGAEIEQHLEKLLEKNTENIANHQESHVGSPILNSTSVLSITRIFACAALVYLHVVVSGPYPQLPEIRNAVCQTIDAFRSLPDQKLVRNLTWPCCIAGCMAIEEQEVFFRAFEPTTSSPLPKFGISSKVLAVIEECWSIRKRNGPGAGPADWNTAMESLELNLLLV